MPVAFRDPDANRCPNCAEIIQAGAILCRHCNSGLASSHFYPCPACAEMVRYEATRCRSCHFDLDPAQARDLSNLARLKPKVGVEQNQTSGGRFFANHMMIKERARLLKNAMIAEAKRAKFGETAFSPDDATFWIRLSSEEQVRARARARELVNADPAPLSMLEKGLLLQILLDDTFGFGPLGPLLRDPSLDALYVLAHDFVVTEHDGRKVLTDVKFDSMEHLRERVRVMLAGFGPGKIEEPEWPLKEAIEIQNGGGATLHVLPAPAAHNVDFSPKGSAILIFFERPRRKTERGSLDGPTGGPD